MANNSQNSRLSPSEEFLSKLDNPISQKESPKELSGVINIGEQIAGTKKDASEKVATHKTQVELEKFKTIASARDNFPVSPENPFEGFKIPNVRKKQFNEFPEEQKNWVLNVFNKAKEAGLQNKDIEKITKSAIDYIYGYNQYVLFFEGKIEDIDTSSSEYALNTIKSKLPDLVSDKAIKQAKDFFETRKEFKMKQSSDLDKKSSDLDKKSSDLDKKSSDLDKKSSDLDKLLKTLKELNELLK
ncbi:MAG: hypothetical protein PHZ26_05055 [Candidatus Gracilibacteria bacterium]|nr:hypothetical protein [Candidatus Gracilibacteria bacterium]MDD2909086.1 hypothetical protein [Candidatus Gracilibacteria bacterium]